MVKKTEPALAPNALLTELRSLIDAARQHVAQTANATLTLLYWHVGQRIRREVLKETRAGYGKEILATLSQELAKDYGKGFNIGLQGAHSEHDLEAAILADMERFLLEMGDGFCFVARQKRLTIGTEDFYIDLLFYHRKLRRLVAVELKLEKFQAAHKGQMELYLRWLDRYERQAGEESPIGLILCASVNREQIEVLQLDESSIRVAEYLTDFPEMETLRAKLHHAIELAREQTARRLLSNKKRGTNK